MEKNKAESCRKKGKGMTSLGRASAAAQAGQGAVTKSRPGKHIRKKNTKVGRRCTRVPWREKGSTKDPDQKQTSAHDCPNTYTRIRGS